MRILRSLLLISLAFVAAAQAQTQKLRVGIFERPPFAMKDADGHWTGIAPAVWEGVSADLSLPFEYVEVEPEAAILDVSEGRLDLLVGELAASSDRAKLVKFSQPYVSFPAAVAVKSSGRFPRWFDFLDDVVQHGVGTMLLILLATMLLFSLMLWFIERKVDRTHFGGRPLHGFGSALWFAAVTMTTVGYGDKTPQSVVGRIIVFFWMFFGVVIVSVFTGTVASSIAVARVQTEVVSVSSLSRYQNGVQADSISQDVLSDIGVPAKVFPTVKDGLRGLETGIITAFVGNQATLLYEVNHHFAGQLVVEPIPDTHLGYAFALRPGLQQRDEIDIAIINQTTRPGWRQKIARFTGPATW